MKFISRKEYSEGLLVASHLNVSIILNKLREVTVFLLTDKKQIQKFFLSVINSNAVDQCLIKRCGII